jgi:hypothetical protein
MVLELYRLIDDKNREINKKHSILVGQILILNIYFLSNYIENESIQFDEHRMDNEFDKSIEDSTEIQ